jgi:hypothetical protein
MKVGSVELHVTKIPKKPWATFDDYLFELRRDNSRSHGEAFPCLVCDGRGQVRREEDYDSMEGWKLAPWYKCTACNGTGEGTREAIRGAWRKALWEWHEKAVKARERRKAEMSVIKQLKRAKIDLTILRELLR